MSCVIVFPLNLRLIIESRCRVSERAREERERVVSWCGVDRKKIVKNEEWKKSIRIENFFLCCSNAISRRPRDDNDEDIECEFCEELFLSLSLFIYVLIILALPGVCVCVESLKIEL